MAKNKERACQDCGNTFLGGQNARYCADCGQKRRDQAVAKYLGKKKKIVSCATCDEATFSKNIGNAEGCTSYCPKQSSEQKNNRPQAGVARVVHEASPLAPEPGRKNYRTCTCQKCGALFSGGPRAWYCPVCREERKNSAYQNRQENKKKGGARYIGGTDICPSCQGQYTVTGPNQKYCPGCALGKNKKNVPQEGDVNSRAISLGLEAMEAWTGDAAQAVTKMIHLGVPYFKCAAHFGCSLQVIEAQARLLGIEYPRQWTDEDNEQLIVLLLNGFSYAQCAETLDRPEITVLLQSHRLRKKGLL